MLEQSRNRIRDALVSTLGISTRMCSASCSSHHPIATANSVPGYGPWQTVVFTSGATTTLRIVQREVNQLWAAVKGLAPTCHPLCRRVSPPASELIYLRRTALAW